MRLEKHRKAVVEACLDLCKCSMMRTLGAGGNVSIRDQESGLIALTPSQVRYDTMSSSDIVLTDVDGKVVEASPGRVPTSELATHTLIYRKFSGINSVVHAHAPFCTAVAAVEDQLPAANYELVYFAAREVPVVPFVMPGTTEMAEVITRILRDVPAMIIRSHGLFVIGEDLHTAVVRAVVVEDAAKLYYYAKTMGKPHLLPLEVKKPG